MAFGGVERVIAVLTNETLHPWVQAMSGVPVEHFVDNLAVTFAFEKRNIEQLWRLIPPN